MMRMRSLVLALVLVGVAWGPAGEVAEAQRGKKVQIAEADLRQWLTYLSSDALEGRQIFTEGYGLATQYIAERLKEAGVKPGGDNGTYFQSVKQHGYRITNNSTLTVEAPGKAPVTFKQGEGVTFATNVGGRQTLTFDGIEFLGYGLSVSEPAHDDYAGRDVKGKLAVWMGTGPSTVPAAGRGGAAARNRYAIEIKGARAAMSFAPAPAPASPAQEALVQAQAALQQANLAVTQAQAAIAQAGRAGGRGGRAGGRGAAPVVPTDLTTVQRVDNPVPPQFTADERVFEAMLASAPRTFAQLRTAADVGDPLPTFSLAGVKVTVNINATYDIIDTRLTKNVVGIVEGRDPALKSTYVLFGAHLDHVGYRTSAAALGGRAGAAAPTGPPDLIFNGADDDGSGSTAILGIARAFAKGPKPKRSVMFVWHSGEESGLQGSRFMADFPTVSLDSVQAQFNIDMIGRNRDNNPSEASTVYVIGADRISTDLHNLVVDANLGTAEPLALNYEYNDPRDPNSFYTRSDHYSYATKGIPVAFFFTGTHPDYHGADDEVDRIIFPKLQRITQMVYEAGYSVAERETPLVRDNLGPRTGKGHTGKIVK
jgi:Peptidase family M28